MGVISIILLGFGLSMDVFAVSICKGLSMKKMNLKKTLIIALYMAGVHAFMPILGYYLGVYFERIVTSFDHWIAFILLTLIGSNMVKESFGNNSKKLDDDVSFKTMFPLAIAVGIDALAVGITFAFLDVNLWFAITILATISLIVSIFGVKIGNKFGDKYQSKAKLFGGIILILIGVKILLEHLGLIF